MKTLLRDVVRRFLDNNGVIASGFLEKDLCENEWRALRFIVYSIVKLKRLPNLVEKVSGLAKIQINGAASRVAYENAMTELLAARFIQKYLKHQIDSVESKSLKIYSPHGKPDKSCDIKVIVDGVPTYFEVKDYSSEKLRSYNPNPQILRTFTPVLPSEFKSWICNKLREASNKGANYLICRMPIWKIGSEDNFSHRWVSEFLSDVEIIGRKEYLATSPVALPQFFYGIYLVKSNCHCFISLKSISSAD